MRAHFLQHVSFEGLGYISRWLEAKGTSVSGTRFYLGEELPQLDGIDLVVIMGGPMSVNDEAEHPWLKAEKAFVREAAARGIAVLGVCLGAQLIADALGGCVFKNAQKEIGWFPIERVAQEGCFQFPEQATVLHWHGETFDLPPGALQIARSAACENQAFQVGGNVIGLQFHLEMTPEAAASITDNCRAELVPARYVQSEEALRAAPAEVYDAAQRLMAEVLEYLTQDVTSAEEPHPRPVHTP